MASLFYSRLAWLSALKGAVAAVVTCWIMGFNWPATLLLTSIGFVSAAFFARRKVGQQRLDVSHKALYAGPASLNDLRSTNRNSARFEMFPNYRESRPRFALFWEVVSRGMQLGAFQKFTVRAFSTQIAICFLLITVFWIASISGWTAPDIHLSRLEALLERAFGINAANARAKAMFDALFVPLSLFYIIPLSGLGAAFIRSAGALSRNVKKYRMVLLGTLGYLAFFALALLPGETRQPLSSLARLIINGNVLGYFFYFCIVPLFGLLLAAELPEKARD
jgi:hypothetical protein